MLCVHGGAANAHWFDFVAAGLTSSYRVFALDLPGHGDSDWSDADSYTGQSYALMLPRLSSNWISGTLF